MNDHDLLTKLDQKMSDMKENQENDAATNIKAHDAILDKIEGNREALLNQSHKFVSTRLFYWLLGFIIIGLVGIGGVTADNNLKISNLKTKVELYQNGITDLWSR